MDKNNNTDTNKTIREAIQEREKWKSVGLTLRHLNSIELWASQREFTLLSVTTTKNTTEKTYLRASYTHIH